MPISDSPPAIACSGLRKEYGDTVAVDSLTLTVGRGEIFGFLGPNGAGKTTSVKMLLGLVLPTAGEGQLLGLPISDPRCRQRVGFLPEDFAFHPWLRGSEFLDLHGRMFGMPRAERARRIPELLELVDLTAAAARPLGTYSKGMLQRIGLAQALINDPALVFLDEPTSGLDPLGRRMVRELLARLRQRGVTVFLNSHLLSEVEVTCTRVAFVAQGSVRLVTDPRTYRAGLLRVKMRVGRVDEGLLAGLRQRAQQVEAIAEPGVTAAGAAAHDGWLRLHLPDEAALPEIARWVTGRGTDLYELAVQPLSLEELFLNVVEGQP
ncbi:MAG: ABC transporter ATP-binding protein [Chloroflexota bacterium]